jgi:hypothetical protein
MNERIKLLAEQAGYDIGPFYTGEDNYQIPHYKDKKLEKFAELIVRECARACEYNEAPPMLDQLTVDQYALIAQGRKTAAYLVKQHFGVEE